MINRTELLERVRNCNQYDEVMEEIELLADWYEIPLKDEYGEWKNGDQMLEEIENAFAKEA